MRSRQVSLPRLRWRTTPGSVEPGARRAAARPCSSATSSSTGSQRVLAAAGSTAAPADVARRDDGDDLSCGDGVARLQRQHADDARRRTAP